MPLFALLSVESLPSRWEPIPLVSSFLRSAGFAGGEGGQWPRALAAAPDGRTIYLGIDVGGIYRSDDSGVHWTPANVGYSPRGCVALAVDPSFPRRVLAVGGNTAVGAHHGIYLSGNAGASWQSVFGVNMAGDEEMREQLVFDPRSKTADRTRIAYWSRIRGDKASWGTPEEHPAIYRTDDGGEHWAQIPNSAPYAGGVLRFDVRSGALMTAGATGVWSSPDGGTSWKQIRPDKATGLDVAPDGTVAYSTEEAIFVKGARESNYRRYDVAERSGPLRNVKVSPIDPRRMVVWSEGTNYDWRRFASEDGGATWTLSKKDAAGAFLPDNSRQGIFCWSPVDAKRLWSIGGDWPTLSTDGGRTYGYSAQGDNALFIGGAFHFNVEDPDLLFFGSQDYNGASTADGGRTWTYRNPSGNGWGGFTYGGYALSASIFVVGNGESWGGPRTLRISEDGGATWRDFGMKLEGFATSLGDPANARIAFVYGHRTADGAKTWGRMSGCDGVFCAIGGKFYGLREAQGGKEVVVSNDHGASWTKLASVPGDVQDVAATPDGRRVYAAAMDLYRVESGTAVRVETPKDQFGNRTVRSVAVDPGDPTVVYAAGAANVYSSRVAAMRSRDGGATWEGLNLTTPSGPGRLDGGREATWVRVHPKTREPWFGTSCYGLWKLAR